MSDKCGHPTTDGSPCENPASDGDSCWIPAHGGDATNHGRSSVKFSKERADQITSHVAEGKSIASAARMEGVSPQAFYNWLDKAPDKPPADPEFEDAPYAYLLDRFVRARGHGEDAYVQDALDLAREEGDLSTLMAMLKQRYPDSWGDVDRGQQTGGVVVNVGDPEEVEIDPDSLEVKDDRPSR